MTYPPFKHFTLMEQTPTIASDSAAGKDRYTFERDDISNVADLEYHWAIVGPTIRGEGMTTSPHIAYVSQEYDAKLIVDALNDHDCLQAEVAALKEENERLRGDCLAQLAIEAQATGRTEAANSFTEAMRPEPTQMTLTEQEQQEIEKAALVWITEQPPYGNVGLNAFPANLGYISGATAATLKERQRIIGLLNVEITEAEAEAELGRGKPGEQFWRGRLNALRTTLLLLDETH